MPLLPVEKKLFAAIQENDEKRVRTALAEMKKLNEDLEQTETIKTIMKPASIEAKDEKGFTPLIQAAKEGRVEIVQILLDNKAQVDNPANNKSTALMCAAQNGHKDCVDLLINSNANLNTKGLWDRTPLMWAAATGQFDCLQVLLEHKVELDNKDTDGCTALTLASKKGDSSCVATLIKAGADLTVKDNKELTAAEHAPEDTVCQAMLTDSNFFNLPEKKLILAVILNDIPLLKEAIAQINHVNDELKKNPSLVGHIEPLSINARNKQNCTPLIVAAIKNRKECLKLLIDNKADLNIATIDGLTALHFAVYYNHDECTKLLSESVGVDLNAKNKNGITALHLAAQKRSKSGIRILLEQKGIDVNTTDENGYTPLIWAAYKGHESCAELLLKAKGINLDVQEIKIKRTALHYAAKKGNTKLCGLLIDQGANTKLKNWLDLTAAEEGCKEVITAAIKKQKGEQHSLPVESTLRSRLNSMWYSFYPKKNKEESYTQLLSSEKDIELSTVEASSPKNGRGR